MLRFVDFYHYCYKCENKNKDEDPCDECLSTTAREDSRKPINFVDNGRDKERRFE